MTTEMYQLKPGLKRGVYTRGESLPLSGLESLLPRVEPNAIINTNKFPFREAIPVYLMSQANFKNPPNSQFLLQNTNKLLNKYYESGVTCLKKKKMESLMIKGLRDIILGYREKKELISLQDYWLYKMSDYLVSKTVNDQKLQFPRLKEFVNVSRFGNTSYLQNSLKMVNNWHEKSDGKEIDLIKWLKNEYKPSLNFIKRSVKHKNKFLLMNMGNESYRRRRNLNLQKMSTLLNLAFDLLGCELGPEIQMKLEKDQKVLRRKYKSPHRKVISFVTKDYPRFNENRNIHSICKKHYKSLFCFPKPIFLKQKLILSKEKDQMKEEETLSNALSIFTKHKLVNRIQEKTVPIEKVPYSKIKYDYRRSNIASKKLFLSHLKFLEDLQNVFGIHANDLASRRPLGKIMKEDTEKNVESMKLESNEFASNSAKEELENISFEIKPSVYDEDEKENKQAYVQEVIMKMDDTQITWTNQLVKKASYIILRFLKNMAAMQFLSCEDVPESKTETESSICTVPSSVKVQLTPMLALKSILSKKKSRNILPKTLKNLRENAKDLYKRIDSKKKAIILEKFKEYNKLFSDASGISTCETEVSEVLQKWDREIMKENLNAENTDLKFFSSDSEQSMISSERDIFEQKGIRISNRRTDHTEVLCLLLLFLSVSDKIISLRKTVKSVIESEEDLIEDNLVLPKKKEGKTSISLLHFRNFLNKTHTPAEVDAYVSIAQKYCPDIIFFEKKKDLKGVKPLPRPPGSDENIPVTTVHEETTVPFRESKEWSEDKSFKSDNINMVGAEESQSTRSEYIHIVEDQSYMSWEGPPCKKGVGDSNRLYRIKHATEWTTYRDVEDFGIPKAFISNDFFEYPSTMNIPKLVTTYYREIRTPRTGDSYILDPTPSSLKWNVSQCLKEDLKLTCFEKHDKDLSWMTKYFTIFWLTEKEAPNSWVDIQKLIFDTWCGDGLCLHDDSWKYLKTLSGTIDDFDKVYRKTRRIYDVSDSRRSLRPERQWLKLGTHVENHTTLGALGIRKWANRLGEMYRELDSPTSTTSVLSRGSSVTGSRLHSASQNDLNVDRDTEKIEIPTGFPLRDVKSLHEVLDEFANRTKTYKAHRLYIYGEHYEPITEHFLKQLNEECGFVYTDDDPEDHPNARFAPPKAIFYSDKEKQFYHHSNNFIDLFQRKYPQRFLKMPYHVKNEYGSMKHICTFISPRRLSWAKMDTWKGCMRCVCNKLECTPLDDANRPPPLLKSPYTTMVERKGNVYELSILLTGFLIGAGYDAYCVCGTATYHRAHYRNTDDVSPDQSDIEGPSTNRYKQYNMIPPFSSTWFRNTAAYKDPIRFEDMETCKVKRRRNAMILEEIKKWPVTEKELIAEYKKEPELKVNHKSRFDNPSVSLQTGSEITQSKWKTKSGEIKTMDLSQLYEELVLELMRRNAQDKSTSKTTKNYINEPTAPLSSKYLKIKMKSIKGERANRRLLKKLQEEKTTEEYEYFDWLYGPNGTHKDFYDIYKAELKRMTSINEFPTVNLIEFLETYDSTKDRVETMHGQQLYFYNQDSIKCKRKIKNKINIRRTIDKKKLEKLKIKQYQEKMIKQNKILKDNDIYGFPKLLTQTKGKLAPALIRKAHKNRLRNSPFIAKMLSKVDEMFPYRDLFLKVVERLGFSMRSLEEPEGEKYLEDMDYDMYKEKKIIRAKAREVQKNRDKKILNRSPFKPNKLHCWVLVRKGGRDVRESFFIDVATGCHYPVSDKNYLKISCVWNHQNYYIPRFVRTYHAVTRDFALENLKIWFHLLPLEPESAVVEKKKKAWWWEAKGHPHQYQHIRMPPYWGRRVRIPALEWDKKFASSNKKKFLYKKIIIEAYDPKGRPTDGLEKRISKFFDMKRECLKEVSTKFSKRKDRLIWRQIDINSGFTEERFEEGRPDHLKIFRYLAYLRPGIYTPKEFQFYGEWRKDKLNNILITKRSLTAEYREGREDHLKRIKFNYAKQKTNKRFLFLDDHSNYIKRIRARFRKVTYDFDFWKESLPEYFGYIPRKLDINMVHKYSEYWYYDDKLRAEVKWKAKHAVGDLEKLMKSEKLAGNPLLLREPLLYGVTKSLEDTPRELTIRKEKYAKREQNDRGSLMKTAKELEQIIGDTLIRREYEKVKDVLRTADDLKNSNISSEKDLHAMKTYFEVERETLARDFKKIKSTNNIWDLWACSEDSLTEKLLNYFIKEQFWLYFVIGGWNDMNNMFKEILKERKEKTPLFSGYTDLLGNLLQAFNHGFRLAEATFPKPPKKNLGICNLQAKVPIEYGLKKFNEIASNLANNECEEYTAKDGFTKGQRFPLNNEENSIEMDSFKMRHESVKNIKKQDKRSNNSLKMSEQSQKTDGEPCTKRNNYLDSNTFKKNKESSNLEKGDFERKFCNHNNDKVENCASMLKTTMKQLCKKKEKRENVAMIYKTTKKRNVSNCNKNENFTTKDGVSIKKGVKKHSNLEKRLKQVKSLGNIRNSLILASKAHGRTNISVPDSMDSQGSTDRGETKYYCSVDIDNYPQLFKLFSQLIKVSYPNHYKEMLISVKNTKIPGWNEKFIDLFNVFINEITGKPKKGTKEGQAIMGLIDTQHPFSYEIKEPSEFLDVLKKLKPAQRPSLEELKNILNFYEKQNKEGRVNIVSTLKKGVKSNQEFKTIVKDFIGLISGKKEEKSECLKKKLKSLRLEEIAFTFENDNNTRDFALKENSEGKIETDYYQLFSGKYKDTFQSVDGLQKFLQELESQPRASLLTKSLPHLMSPVDFLELHKGKYYRRRAGEDFGKCAPNRKELTKDRGTQHFTFNEIIKRQFNDNHRSKLSMLNVRRHIDIGIVDVINLFSKPSELQFTVTKCQKQVKLRQILREREIELLDTKTIDLLQRIFPIDYYKLHLYEQKLSRKGVINFDESINKKIWNYKEINLKSSINRDANHLRIKPLQKTIESCPHCLNVYYQANKDRIHMLEMVEYLRDDNFAGTFARSEDGPLPAKALEAHLRALKTFGDYVTIAQDISSIYESYKNKIVCDECHQYKYFLDLLNFKVLYDYFEASILFRKMSYKREPREFIESEEVSEPIPYYHGKRPSVDRVSLVSLLQESKAYIQRAKSSEKTNKLVESTLDESKILYPKVDESNAIQMELFRDIRERPIDSLTDKQISSIRKITAYTIVTKRNQRKNNIKNK